MSNFKLAARRAFHDYQRQRCLVTLEVGEHAGAPAYYYSIERFPAWTPDAKLIFSALIRELVLLVKDMDKPEKSSELAELAAKLQPQPVGRSGRQEGWTEEDIEAIGTEEEGDVEEFLREKPVASKVNTAITYLGKLIDRNPNDERLRDLYERFFIEVAKDENKERRGTKQKSEYTSGPILYKEQKLEIYSVELTIDNLETNSVPEDPDYPFAWFYYDSFEEAMQNVKLVKADTQEEIPIADATTEVIDGIETVIFILAEPVPEIGVYILSYPAESSVEVIPGPITSLSDPKTTSKFRGKLDRLKSPLKLVTPGVSTNVEREKKQRQRIMNRLKHLILHSDEIWVQAFGKSVQSNLQFIKLAYAGSDKIVFDMHGREFRTIEEAYNANIDEWIQQDLEMFGDKGYKEFIDLIKKKYEEIKKQTQNSQQPTVVESYKDEEEVLPLAANTYQLLIKIADLLDSRGFIKAADQVDSVLKDLYFLQN